MDIHRSKLYINNRRVYKELAALNYILYTFGEQAYDYLALCTQATCASAFEWLHFSLPESYYLTEADTLNRRDKQSKIFLVQNKSGEESQQGDTIQYLKTLQIIRIESSKDGQCTEKEVHRKVFLKISIDVGPHNSGDTTIEIHLE